MRIVAAGHVCADLIPDLPPGTAVVPGRLTEVGAIVIEAGGAVANTGRVLARLGHEVTASAVVGDDDLGSILRNRIAAAGLDPAGLVSGEQATSYSIVVQPQGQNRSFWHHIGANAAFDGSGVELTGADVVHLGYPPVLARMVADRGGRLLAMLRRAHEGGVTTSIDMAVVDQRSAAARLDWHDLYGGFLPLTDLFSPSVDDLTSTLRTQEVTTRADVDRLADELLALGAGIVMVTAGEDGLLVRGASRERLEAGSPRLASLAPVWADAREWADARPVARLLTTNGAGDAATAALIHAVGLGLGPDETAGLIARIAAAHIEGGEVLDVL